MSKYNYTYLVIPTNKESSFFGKVYFGQHHTDNLNDNYTGSGKLICKYINKHPNDYYKEIIKFYDSQEELNKAEYELIHPHLGKDYCMNLVEGGIFGRLHPDIYKEISKNKKEKFANGEIIPWNKGKKGVQIAWNKGLINCCSEEAKLKLRIARLGKTNSKLSNYNKEHNAEKNKRNKTGVRMMNNGIINKQIHKEEFDLYLSKGFTFGMLKNRN